MNFSYTRLMALSFFLATRASAGLEIDKEQSLAKSKLQKIGLELTKANRVVLNQHLKAERAEDLGLYQVTFTCTHRKTGKEDSCELQKVDFRKTIAD